MFFKFCLIRIVVGVILKRQVVYPCHGKDSVWGWPLFCTLALSLPQPYQFGLQRWFHMKIQHAIKSALGCKTFAQQKNFFACGVIRETDFA